MTDLLSMSHSKVTNTSKLVNTPSAIHRMVWRNPLFFFAFGFGSGLARFAPGTWGTLFAIPFYLLLSTLNWQLYLSFVIVAFIVGIWLCDRAEKWIGIKDYPGIVWDEMVGYWLTMFLAPPGIVWIVVGFVLFRIFDIAKPWPINWVQKKTGGGFGIMIDDLLAAIYSFAVLQFLVFNLHLL